MATNKTISLAVTIRPFQVPDFVVLVPKEPVSRSEEQPGIPLSDLDAYTLYELCEEFTNATPIPIA